MSNDPKVLQEWLRRLKWALAAIPEPEREDIWAETRAHLLERIESGRSVAEALQGFGAPEDYARQYVDQMELATALGSQRVGTMLLVVGRRLHRNIVAALAGVLLVPLGAAVLMAASLLFFEFMDPVHTGLWRGAHEFFIGKIADPTTATDLLGEWIWPLCIAVIVAGWLGSRLVMLRALRALAR